MIDLPLFDTNEDQEILGVARRAGGRIYHGLFVELQSVPNGSTVLDGKLFNLPADEKWMEPFAEAGVTSWSNISAFLLWSPPPPFVFLLVIRALGFIPDCLWAGWESRINCSAVGSAFGLDPLTHPNLGDQ